MSVFSFDDYKKFIESQIRDHAQVRGYKTDLATGAGCQRSFFSQMLHGHVHLTPDHAAGLSYFFEMNEREREYFMELVHLARASTKALREMTQRKLLELRKQNEDLALRFKKANPVNEAEQLLYYSSWHWSAIHIALTIPTYQEASSLSRLLNLKPEFVEQSLSTLKELGYVERLGKKWVASQKLIHLPKLSALTSMNHSNWRARAVANSQLQGESSVHYTAVCSLSQSDFIKLKDMVLQFLDQTRSIIEPSKEEELACLNLDWFKV